MRVCVMDLQQRAFRNEASEPGIAIFIYDANGQEHGRSEAGFKWAFDIEGSLI